eukprot:11183614-Lingulodinium_polyedra.AAC.1
MGRRTRPQGAQTQGVGLYAFTTSLAPAHAAAFEAVAKTHALLPDTADARLRAILVPANEDDRLAPADF